MIERRLFRVLSGSAGVSVLVAGRADAHASEQGFVLLLPTDAYITAGCLTVVLTALLLLIIPDAALIRLFSPRSLWRGGVFPRLRRVANLLATAVLLWLIWSGFTGSHDPLVNPLSLSVWALWWVILVAVQGLFGDLWRWISPWRSLTILAATIRPPLRYPRRLEQWPAVGLFLGFAAFLLTDIAPADPDRLAWVLSAYAALTLTGTVLFGPRWLTCAEFSTVLMRQYARIAAPGRVRGRFAIGTPGWKLTDPPSTTLSQAILIICMLAVGSFDGFNETFTWMGVLGINPLEFPGRSAVISANLIGLVASVTLLIAVFCLTLWLGDRLARSTTPLTTQLRLFAPGLLPIALAYHIAHYLPVLLVDGQYILACLANLTDTGPVHVTTGFFFRPDSVRLIWLTQAGAIVIGHVLGILVTHRLALRPDLSSRRIWLGHLPLTGFMVLYTLFGLWLLATPRV